MRAFSTSSFSPSAPDGPVAAPTPSSTSNDNNNANNSSQTKRPNATDYRSLFLSDAPLMDVRAPIEFAKGAFPQSHNLPLMMDNERAQVGTCFKESGQAEAIALGHELVTGVVKADRVKSWTDFCAQHPDHGYLYCFRGGLRSRIVQQWVKQETGVEYPMVTGGYKAMRTFLMNELERSLQETQSDLIIVAGKTGTGKTLLLHQLPNNCSVDLEGLAHHRGSSFGEIPEDPGQPRQIDFENAISVALLKLLSTASSASNKTSLPPRVFVEDEGSRIGRLCLPPALWKRMQTRAKVVLVEEPIEERIDQILTDYVSDLRQRFEALYGLELGTEKHIEFMYGSLERLRKRIGGDRHQELKSLMQEAFAAEKENGDTSLHRVWIQALLEQYYDPMYEHQMKQPYGELLFRGTRQEVVDWATRTS